MFCPQCATKFAFTSLWEWKDVAVWLGLRWSRGFIPKEISIAIFQSPAPYNDIEDFSNFAQSELTTPEGLRIPLPNCKEVFGNQHLKVTPDTFPVSVRFVEENMNAVSTPTKPWRVPATEIYGTPTVWIPFVLFFSDLGSWNSTVALECAVYFRQQDKPRK